jgi:hypothetical protein
VREYESKLHGAWLLSYFRTGVAGLEGWGRTFVPGRGGAAAGRAFVPGWGMKGGETGTALAKQMNAIHRYGTGDANIPYIDPESV